VTSGEGIAMIGTMLAWGDSVISPSDAMRLLLLLSFLALPFLASAQRKKMEQAATYEQAGMLQEAYDRYAHLYQKKARNVQAHVGMKRTAQGLFDRIQQDASGHYLLNDLAAGERKRLEAVNFKRSMDAKGLDLQWDPLFASRRQEAQRHEAERLFRQAEEAFRADRFAEAEELTSASLKLDADRKEAEYLLKLAQLEPLYRQGKRAMELELWREAFRSFKRITDRDAVYKDAWTLQEEAKEKAQVIIAYVPLFNNGVYANNIALSGPGQLESQLAAAVKQYILNLNEPLILLVERDNTEELLAEQQRQMTGVYDDRYVVEAGKLIGARYVLTAKILRYDEILRRDIEVQVQLLDAESGRIHVSEVVKVNKFELGRGNTRNQLMERAAKRTALRLAEFDPHKR
jgi:hypothetical protein